MNKMKKNPLDDFFAERLSEHQVAPSQRAMDRFQERLAERDRKAAPFLGIRPRSWYYYGAAASVVLLMTIGYMEYKSGNGIDKTQVVASVPAEKHIDNPNPILKADSPALAQTQSEVNAPDQVTKVVTEKETLKTKISQQKLVAVQDKSTVDKLIEDIEIDERPKDQLALAVEKAELKNTPVRIAANETGSLFKSDAGSSVVIRIISEEEEIILPNQDSGTKMSRAVAMAGGEEKSVFSKVFGELKNLKHGEKVDLTKLGLRSADNNVAGDEGFVASETRQLKQGWQWIKGKINNN